MATRTFRGAVSSDWGTAGNWLEGAVPSTTDDVVFDGSSPNCTVNASHRTAKTITFTGYTNTIALNYNIGCYGNVILANTMTISGAGAFYMYATATFTSNGVSIPKLGIGNTTMAITFADNLTVIGDFIGAIVGATITLTGSTIYVGGNLQFDSMTSGIISGTTVICMNGTGTLSTILATGSSTTFGGIACYLEINTSGTITIGSLLNFRSNTFKITSGTVITTNSLLKLGQNFILDSSSVTWNNVTLYFVGHTSGTLLSDFNIAGNFYMGSGGYTYTLNGYTYKVGGNLTFSGSSTALGTSTFLLNGTGVFTVGFSPLVNSFEINTSGTITFASTVKIGGNYKYTAGTVILTNSTVYLESTATALIDFNNLVFNNLIISGSAKTINVKSNFSITGLFSTSNLSANSILQSDTTGIKRTITLTGTQDIGMLTVTDIDSSGGQSLWCFRGVLSNTTNWYVLIKPQTIANVF